MTSTPPLCLCLTDPRARDLAVVGGKSANLAELTQAGFPVPRGFCLTTEAFRLFVAGAPDADALLAPLEALTANDLDEAREHGQRVRQALLDLPIPPVVAAAVGRCLAQLGAEDAYAVRSSATAEDLPEASFAGQQDTFLNVIGLDAVLGNLRRCWVSLYTDRAILYRLQQGIGHRDVALAVVVQRMVPSQVSGILFTADPLSGHRHTLTIDAAYGLGDALVGGLVTPDTYRVDKRGGVILASQLADDPDRQGQPVLTDAQILELAELGQRVESHYGAPQDIEWAIADGRVHLLQARPITSLYPIDGLRSPDGGLRVFLSIGHQQSMLGAMSPLGLSTILLALPDGQAGQASRKAFVRTSGGRLFADVTIPLQRRPTRKLFLRAMSQFDPLAPRALDHVIGRPEFPRPTRLRPSRAVLKVALMVARRVLRTFWRRDLTGFVARTNALMDDYIEEQARVLSAVPWGRERLAAVVGVIPGAFPFFLNWLPEAGAGIAATRLLARLAGRWLDPDQVEDLTLAIPGNVVQEMNLAIGDLANAARTSPDLVDAFENLGDDGKRWLEKSVGIPGAEDFYAAWSNFLERYGARGPSEIDMARPRWYEDPTPVLRVIAQFLRGDVGRHRALEQASIQRRERAMTILCSKAGRGMLGRLRLRVIERLYHVMTHVGGMREHHKLLMVRLLALAKESLKETAAELVEKGKLAQADDIWFLTWPELLGDWDDAAEWDRLIAQRRADLRRFDRLKPPLFITSDGEGPTIQHSAEDAPEGALVGAPVCPGVAEGVVRVLRDPHTESLEPGEILVAEFTDPGWTPLFINAGGLVLEIGGTLTHGAIVAREYGIPAVVGVRDATARLRTGQRVRVDGDRGFVELL